jgi:hypothetical protein
MRTPAAGRFASSRLAAQPRDQLQTNLDPAVCKSTDRPPSLPFFTPRCRHLASPRRVATRPEFPSEAGLRGLRTGSLSRRQGPSPFAKRGLRPERRSQQRVRTYAPRCRRTSRRSARIRRCAGQPGPRGRAASRPPRSRTRTSLRERGRRRSRRMAVDTQKRSVKGDVRRVATSPARTYTCWR